MLRRSGVGSATAPNGRVTFRQVIGKKRSVRFVAIALAVAAGILSIRIGGLDAAPSTAQQGVIQYMRSQAAYLVYGDPEYAYLQPKVREIWITPGGGGRLHEEYEEPDFFGERARSAWANSYRRPAAIDLPLGTGAIDVIPSAPTLPEDFAKLVEHEGGASPGHRGQAALRVARELLTEAVPGPVVRSAVLEGLLSTPELNAECVVDPAERPGIRFSVEAGRPLVRYALTLDSSGHLLHEDQQLLELYPAIDGPPPVLIARALYEAWGPVGTTSERIEDLVSEEPSSRKACAIPIP